MVVLPSGLFRCLLPPPPRCVPESAPNPDESDASVEDPAPGGRGGDASATGSGLAAGGGEEAGRGEEGEE